MALTLQITSTNSQTHLQNGTQSSGRQKESKGAVAPSGTFRVATL